MQELGGIHMHSDIIATFLAHLEAQKRSPLTVRRRRYSLTSLAEFCDPLPVLQADEEIIEQWLSTYHKPTTRHSYFSDARMFYAWAVRRQLIERHPMLEMEGPDVPKALPRPLTTDVVELAIGTAHGPVRRILMLAAFAGLRRSEIANLTAADVNLFSRPPMIVIRNGKGAKDRGVPIHPRLLDELRFISGSGAVVTNGGDPLPIHTVGWLAQNHLRHVCGVDATLHQLRHSFCTELARVSNGNVPLVATLAGHANINTTMIYIALAGSAKHHETVTTMFGADDPLAS